MKKVLLLSLFLMIVTTSYAEWDITIKNPSATKGKSIEAVKKWVATTLDSKNASIKYEDAESGVIIINGEYKDANPMLKSIRYGFISAEVSFQLEIKCEDQVVYAKFNKITYSTKSLYGDYSLSTFLLERIRDELKVIAELEIEKGQTWIIDKDFQNEYKELDQLVDEAEKNKDDSTLPKKERKRYKKFYEENNVKKTVYLAVYAAKVDLEYCVLSQTGTGIWDVIKNIK